MHELWSKYAYNIIMYIYVCIYLLYIQYMYTVYCLVISIPLLLELQLSAFLNKHFEKIFAIALNC